MGDQGQGATMGDQGQGATYTLDQAFSAIGFGKFQLYLLAYAGLGSIAEAMEMMLLSFIGLGIQSEMNLTSTQVNLISVVSYAGLLLGSYLLGIVSDRYGRKIGIIGASIVAIVSGLVSIGTFSYTWLLLLRGIFGVGLGGGHIFNSWFMEFVPTPNRGYWMVVFSAFFTAGTIVQALLVLLIMPNYNWRWLLGGAIAPHFVALCFIWSMPESPRFLCAQGRVGDAQYVLANGATLNKKKLPEGTLVYDQINSTAGTDQPVRTPGPLERSDEAHVEHVVGSSSPPRTHEASGDSTLTTPLLHENSANPDQGSLASDLLYDASPRRTRSSYDNSGDPVQRPPVADEISGTPAQKDLVTDDNSGNPAQTSPVTDDFSGHPTQTARDSDDTSGNPAQKDLVTDDISGNPAQMSPVTDDFSGHPTQTTHDSDDISIHSSETTHASTEIFEEEHDDETPNNDRNEILNDQHDEIKMPNDEPKENTRFLQSSEIGSGVSHSKTSIYEILSPRWRRTTLLIWFLYFCNTFNYFEIVLLTSQSSTGSLLASEAFKISWPLLTVVITSLAEIPGLIIAAMMLNKFGRKSSMEILFGAGFIVLFPMVFFQSEAVTIVFAFLARMFISSSFVLAQIYSTEAYPTQLRATGVGVAMALGNIGGTVCPLVASVIRDSGHKMFPFILFEAKILLSGLCVWLLPVETTEKKLVLPVQRDPPPD